MNRTTPEATGTCHSGPARDGALVGAGVAGAFAGLSRPQHSGVEQFAMFAAPRLQHMHLQAGRTGAEISVTVARVATGAMVRRPARSNATILKSLRTGPCMSIGWRAS